MCARDLCLHEERDTDARNCRSGADTRLCRAEKASTVEKVAALTRLRQSQLATRAEQLHVLDTLLSESIRDFGSHEVDQFAGVQDTLRVILVEVSNAQLDLAVVRSLDGVMAISDHIADLDSSVFKLLQLGRRLMLTTTAEDKEEAQNL